MTHPRHSDGGRARIGTPDCHTAIVGLCRAVDCVSLMIEKVLEPHDITGQQYNVLRVLRSAPDGLPTLTVAERLIDRAPGITRMMDRLEAKGLVERERSGDDRRLVKCRITKRGTDMLERLDKPVEDARRTAFAALGSEEVAQLVTLLERVTVGRTHPRAEP
jgi:DNA-binding MarR family transcriptional regulator